jgi:hypothetical protein
MGAPEIQKALTDAGAQVSFRVLNTSGARSIHLTRAGNSEGSSYSSYYPGLNNFQGLERAIAEVPSGTTPIISLCSFGANNADNNIFGYDWRAILKTLCQDLRSLQVPIVTQFHAAYSSPPLMDFIRQQAIVSTQIARNEGVWTPTDTEALDMIASFYRANQSYYDPNPSDGIHYNTHSAYHGQELAPIFARAIK